MGSDVRALSPVSIVVFFLFLVLALLPLKQEYSNRMDAAVPVLLTRSVLKAIILESPVDFMTTDSNLPAGIQREL